MPEMDDLRHLRDNAWTPREPDVLILEERLHITLPVGCVEACGCVGKILKHRIAWKSGNHSIIVLLEVIVSERSCFDLAGQTEQQEHRVHGLKLTGDQCFQRLLG